MFLFPNEIFTHILSFAGDKLHIKRDNLWRSITLVNLLRDDCSGEQCSRFYITIKNHLLPTSVKWVRYDGDGGAKSICVYPRLISFGHSSYDLVKKFDFT